MTSPVIPNQAIAQTYNQIKAIANHMTSPVIPNSECTSVAGPYQILLPIT